MILNLLPKFDPWPDRAGGMIGRDLVLRWAATARNSRLQMGQEQFEAARTLGFEIRNPQRFAQNMARLVEEAGKAAAIFMQPYATNPTRFTLHDDLAPALGTLAQLQRAWLQRPDKVLEAQVALWNSCFDLWHSSMRRFMGLKNGAGKDTCHLAPPGSPVQASSLVRTSLLRPAETILSDHLALGRIALSMRSKISIHTPGTRPSSI